MSLRREIMMKMKRVWMVLAPSRFPCSRHSRILIKAFKNVFAFFNGRGVECDCNHFFNALGPFTIFLWKGTSFHRIHFYSRANTLLSIKRGMFLARLAPALAFASKCGGPTVVMQWIIHHECVMNCLLLSEDRPRASLSTSSRVISAFSDFQSCSQRPLPSVVIRVTSRSRRR